MCTSCVSAEHIQYTHLTTKYLYSLQLYLHQFWMSNKPANEAQRYGVCWGDPENWSSERDHASLKLLRTLRPEGRNNQLKTEIGRVIKKLESEAPRLEEEDKFVSVVICTHGVPTNEFGESSSAVMKEYISSLKALNDLPVKIVLRLVTNEKKVMNFYKKVDLSIDCDVLGNYWEEVRRDLV